MRDDELVRGGQGRSDESLVPDLAWVAVMGALALLVIALCWRAGS